MRLIIITLLSLALLQCGKKSTQDITAFVGARIINGTMNEPVEEGVLLITNGKIINVGASDEVTIPKEATIINLEGKTIIPGIVNAHGHIGGTTGLQSIYSQENVIRDLNTLAHYGVTTVFSLGGDEQPSADIRHGQDTVQLNGSRLFIAGDVVAGNSPEEARAAVVKNASMKVDVIKIRVDDNLGTTEKMKPEVYEAVIDQAKKYNLPVAAHIFYLDDAKAMLKLGVRMIAHSVRDREVDEEFIQLMLDNNAYYCPTLMREVSTYVYEAEPTFFTDPFFLSQADTSVVRQLKDPAYQKRIQESTSAGLYKQGLIIAKRNLKILIDRGVRIAMGTDSGPAGRFQGYFEHLELELMVESGLSPQQVLNSATQVAAQSLNRNEIGTLLSGQYADFIILQKNPLEDITNTRSIESVWMGGNKVH